MVLFGVCCGVDREVTVVVKVVFDEVLRNFDGPEKIGCLLVVVFLSPVKEEQTDR